jgi:hypothetical protein
MVASAGANGRGLMGRRASRSGPLPAAPDRERRSELIGLSGYLGRVAL